MELSNPRYIFAKDYPLSEILSKKYTVDYFQREYKWEKEHIEQLVLDLTTAFLSNYKEGDKTKDVASYSPYYMGSIVISERLGKDSIIDGQQRITSLTLFLIYLNHLTNKEMESQIGNMIFSDSFGEMSFNIDVEERVKCLKSLYVTGEYTPTDSDDESTQNMWARYQDICNCFPSDILTGNLLKSFVYWVKDKLVLVKISAMSDDDAYTIFETINNRGMTLTLSDMLKGFILSKFTDDESRMVVNSRWRKDMIDLKEYNDAENQFFQAWLRSQFADTIRQSQKDSLNQDFEIIGTKFHNWFKDNYDKGLLKEAINDDIETFMNVNYRFFLKWFLMIKKASSIYDAKLPHLYFIQQWGIAPSLSYQLLLAPLTVSDSDDVCIAKIEIVAKYIDGFVVRRAVNFKLFSANSIRYTMCVLTKTIRHKGADALKQILAENMSKVNEDYNFQNSMQYFRAHGMNKYFIKYFLSRITSFVEIGCGIPGSFDNYFKPSSGKPFEIEHIWSDHFEWHEDEFDQTEEFENRRNNIGDLILLPNGTNQSLNDMKTPEKLPHYLLENILAQALCEMTYNKNPNFIHFITRIGLYSPDKEIPGYFKTFEKFDKDAIADRCRLYANLADLIWDVDLNN